jgi:hypothetical protein
MCRPPRRDTQATHEDEHFVARGARPILAVGPKMRVRVERLSRAGMAQSGLCDLDRLAVADQ